MIGYGLFSLTPAIMLLAVSFFVMFAASKTDSKALKTFGTTIAVLLWIIAGLMLILSLYIGISGKSGIFPFEAPWRYHWGYQHMMR
jgi:hypothetical protein